MQTPERWNVPTPLETVRVQMADGAPITLRRHGNPSGPRMVFSHGNALAADLYYPFWSLLMDRFDIVLYDVRSHGWNPVWGRQTHNFPTFVSDSQSIAREIDAHLGAKPQIGVFQGLQPGVIELFSQTTLRPDGEGDMSCVVRESTKRKSSTTTLAGPCKRTKKWNALAFPALRRQSGPTPRSRSHSCPA